MPSALTIAMIRDLVLIAGPPCMYVVPVVVLLPRRRTLMVWLSPWNMNRRTRDLRGHEEVRSPFARGPRFIC